MVTVTRCVSEVDLGPLVVNGVGHGLELPLGGGFGMDRPRLASSGGGGFVCHAFRGTSVPHVGSGYPAVQGFIGFRGVILGGASCRVTRGFDLARLAIMVLSSASWRKYWSRGLVRSPGGSARRGAGFAVPVAGA